MYVQPTPRVPGAVTAEALQGGELDELRLETGVHDEQRGDRHNDTSALDASSG